MFLRPNHRDKDGKADAYWSLVETVRTADGPRQKMLCYLGELNHSAQARWLTTVEVFNDQGEAQQLKLFPSHVAAPPDDPQVARVLVNRVRLERTRQFGACYLGLDLWRRLGLGRFFEQAVDEDPADVPWSRVAAVRAINRLCDAGSELAVEQRWYPSTALERSAGHRRRQDQRHALVSLFGSHPATQDQAGAAPQGALRSVVRSRVRRAFVRSDEHVCGGCGGEESDDAPRHPPHTCSSD